MHSFVRQICRGTKSDRYIENKQYQLDDSKSNLKMEPFQFLQYLEHGRTFEVTMLVHAVTFAKSECPRRACRMLFSITGPASPPRDPIQVYQEPKPEMLEDNKVTSNRLAEGSEWRLKVNSEVTKLLGRAAHDSGISVALGGISLEEREAKHQRENYVGDGMKISLGNALIVPLQTSRMILEGRTMENNQKRNNPCQEKSFI
ncbi:hypothetical protein BKA70DRAFT_1225202 [Coprinopsis sp. MPI-PUGE-AT-0042]|nr:hypothetical protein BKA70DRAFT_1225202 [Coprinopsis sp. MPI-PUGE-AT-0042]